MSAGKRVGHKASIRFVPLLQEYHTVCLLEHCTVVHVGADQDVTPYLFTCQQVKCRWQNNTGVQPNQTKLVNSLHSESSSSTSTETNIAVWLTFVQYYQF